jgi:hypothetical protein
LLRESEGIRSAAGRVEEYNDVAEQQLKLGRKKADAFSRRLSEGLAGKRNINKT